MTSRFNGCVYCASVHTGRAIAESADDEDAAAKADAIQRLCDEGVSADLGSALWNAIRDASVALATVPVRFGAPHVTALRDAVDAGEDPQAALAAAEQAAVDAARGTAETVARRGRASYVGDAAKGVIDPGAAAMALVLGAARTAVDGGGEVDTGWIS